MSQKFDDDISEMINRLALYTVILYCIIHAHDIIEM